MAKRKIENGFSVFPVRGTMQFAFIVYKTIKHSKNDTLLIAPDDTLLSKRETMNELNTEKRNF